LFPLLNFLAIDMKKIIPMMLIVSLVLVSGCIGQAPEPKAVFQKDYFGYTQNFRADPDLANNVLVLPNEDEVGRVLLNGNLTKVRVAFIPNDTENGYILAASFEVTYKLTTAYREFFGEALPIEPLQVSSREEAVRYASQSEPVVLILGPSNSNKTAVRKYSDYVIIAEGADISEVGRKYTDIDLAVDKLVMVVMQRAQDIIQLSTTGKLNVAPEMYVPGKGWMPVE